MSSLLMNALLMFFITHSKMVFEVTKAWLVKLINALRFRNLTFSPRHEMERVTNDPPCHSYA